jgi:hypothetical protein
MDMAGGYSISTSSIASRLAPSIITARSIAAARRG